MTEVLILDADWTLRPADVEHPALHGREPVAAPFAVPGDVHSALLADGIIEEPYYRDNEYAVDWVNQVPWTLERLFDAPQSLVDRHCVLVIEGLDCIARVFVNEQLAGALDNQFVRHVLPLSGLIQPGSNHLRIEFDVALEVAEQRKHSYLFELPGESLNSRLPNNNFLRKTPCHSGWDWNICLMPSGIYGQVRLECVERCRLDDVRVNRVFDDRDVRLELNLNLQVFRHCQVDCVVTVGETRVVCEFELYPGQQQAEIDVLLREPALWWPAGMGEQSLHELSVTMDGTRWIRSIGLCRTRIVRKPDEQGPGSGFHIEVNDQAAFMRGANWIPADALPARGTPEVVRELLASAVDANMNMLRVWGGGQYESDWFYELCDELGILVWQDFMFSCNHYPASDAHWIASVRSEATQQVRRLSRFACVALWCGDNELVGALKWWEITALNRDRYLANYVRLNTALEEIVKAEVPATPWWPSSPSQGLLDYADGWKSDVAGDMHFWDVWHEAKPFSAYQEIRPRFCSEFGFQSFPSMPTINSFTEARDRNVSSAVMDVHQRNVGGNARIVETLVRYFPFPDSFERTVFLSQCQQAMAITTAVEYWRSLKPHCMGTLYWQLNDTWPVASWSSLEYGGGWKLLHYAARRFFKPVTMMIVPVDRPVRSAREYGSDELPADSPLSLCAVNDTRRSVQLDYTLLAIDMDGLEQRRWQGHCTVGLRCAEQALALMQGDIPDGCFLLLEWSGTESDGASNTGGNALSGTAEYWPRPYKRFALPQATLRLTEVPGTAAMTLQLESDKPAFFVSVEAGGRRVWSDNGITVLPGRPRTLSLRRNLANRSIPDVASLVVEHL